MSSEAHHPAGHPPGHAQGHGTGHHRSHDHEHDAWSGEAYLARPGIIPSAVPCSLGGLADSLPRLVLIRRETARISHDSVVHALRSAGLTAKDLSAMYVLEIGCGGGAVTSHLLHTFASVHALDTSPSMLLAFSTSHPPPPSPSAHQTTTHALHALSPASPGDFAALTPMASPTRADPERTLRPPRARFDLALANMVVHHVDDLDGFMSGLIGLLREGGWVVFTEFGRVEGGRDVAGEIREDRRKSATTAGGSVNAPGHYHASFTPESISAVLEKHGLVDVHAEIKGSMPVFGPGKEEVPCLIVRGRKAGTSAE